MSCNELIERIIHMSIHPADTSIQSQLLNIWDKQPELIARCLVGCTEWEFTSKNAMRLCVPFSYFSVTHTSHLFSIAKHYFAIILLYGIARCFFQQFLAETQFWSSLSVPLLDHITILIFLRWKIRLVLQKCWSWFLLFFYFLFFNGVIFKNLKKSFKFWRTFCSRN